MHTQTEKQPSGFLLRFRKQDTPTGVSIETIEKLAEVTGLTKTELVHFALRELANKFLPPYEADDAELTDGQLSIVQANSAATNISDDAFTEKLFLCHRRSLSGRFQLSAISFGAAFHSSKH